LIIDALFSAIQTPVVNVLNSMSSWFTIPVWYPEALGFWQGTLDDIADMAHFVPLSAVGQVGILIFSASVIAISVKVIRLGISLFSGGGGSAA